MSIVDYMLHRLASFVSPLAEENLQGARELLRNGAFDGLRDNIRYRFLCRVS